MSLLDNFKKKIEKKPKADKTAQIVSTPKKKAEKKQEAESVKKEDKIQEGTSVQSRKYVYDMLTHPYVTEKTSALKADANKYVFIVAKTANKPELKKAIQEKYKVTVTKVNMINIPSRKIIVGRTMGTKTGFRKAIVTLKAGDSIEIGI